MGSNAQDKWLSRAERYEEVLGEEGVSSAEKYLMQFHQNLRRLLDALWELHLLKVKKKKVLRRERQLYLARRAEKSRID